MRKMVKEMVFDIVEHIVSKEVVKNQYSWPPPCTSFFYQPKRVNNGVKESNK